MTMVGSMDNGYVAHAHHRSSLSSLASTVMPLVSDPSTMTSVTASPLEANDMSDAPIELKLPPPASSSSSDRTFQLEQTVNDNIRQPENSGTGNDVQDFGSKTAPSDVERATVDDSSNLEEVSAPSTAPQEDDSREATFDSSKPEALSAPSSLPNLDELIRMARDEDYENQRATALEAKVKNLAATNSVHRRLKDTLSIAYANMIDQYKGDDQAGFTGLYEACERLTTQCNSYGSGSTEADNLTLGFPSAAADDDEVVDSPRPQLRDEDQDSILIFLNKIRMELDYLADLISDLPSHELSALTSSYHPAGVDLSVLPNHSHGRTQAYSRDSQMMKLSRRMDGIDRFHNQDPYFCLLHGLFDSSASLESTEHRRKNQIWARTTSRVMCAGKLGSEEFTIATIDSFVDTKDWTLKPNLELYLLQVLSEGYFLLDPPEENLNAKPGSMEPDKASHAIAVAEFFDKHTRRLFAMLTTGIPSDAIPKGVLGLIHTILLDIKDGQMRELAKKFIVSRWYFATFLSSVLVYPEVQGMLLNHHIGNTARQYILKELVLRLQSQMFSVLSPSSSFTFVLPEVQDQIFQIIGFFDPPSAQPSPSLPTQAASVDLGSQRLMLSNWDLIGVVEALLPPPASSSIIGTQPLTSGPPTSGASSSTLNPDRSEAADSHASSTTASYATSTSTDTTAVGDISPSSATDNGPGSTVPQGNTLKMGKMNNEETLQHSLAKACLRLRELARAQANPLPIDSSKGWLCFDIMQNLTLRASRRRLYHTPGTELTSDSSIGSKEPDTSHVKYIHMKRELFGLLSQEETVPVAQGADADSKDDLSPGFFSPLIEGRLESARWQHEFLETHKWWQILAAYRDLQRSRGAQSLDQSLINDLTTDAHRMTAEIRRQVAELEAGLRALTVQSKSEGAALKRLASLRRALRIKMWYVSDVKHSSQYEDALHVTKALRTMANPKKSKQPSGLASWARQRLRGSTPYDRADRQALEAICATKEQGGLDKLGDDQVEITSRWLTRNSIENFCKGEERIHRFCYEVQKILSKLAGTSMLESPVLWSSHLFRKEKAAFDTRNRQHHLSAIHSPASPFQGFGESGATRQVSLGFPHSPKSTFLDARTQVPMDFSRGLQISSLSRFDQHRSMPGLPRGQAPSFTASQALGSLSPPMTPLSPNISEVFGASIPNRTEQISKPRVEFVEEVKGSLLALIISDLGYLLWGTGSETDRWVERAAGARHEARNSKSSPLRASQESHPEPEQKGVSFEMEDIQPIELSVATSPSKLLQERDTPEKDLQPSPARFPYSNAYATLLQTMSLSQDPYAKLHILCQLEDLITSSLQDARPHRSLPRSAHTSASTEKKTIPRTKATSLEEVIANCTERRASTMKRKQPRSPLPEAFLTASSLDAGRPSTVSADEVVSTLLTIFRDDELRPPTLYRDLQYIAAFIPSAVLDQTARGKAFWDTSLAALALKEDFTSAMIDRASQITDYHISSRKSTTSKDAMDISTSEIPLTPPWLANSSLGDAAQLWLTAAKEGSPVAARELSLFYLTHPDLLRRVTAPMSKGKDVFGTALPIDQNSGGALDPLTFSVVLHWMDVAASGGDREAKDFLRDNGVLTGT